MTKIKCPHCGKTFDAKIKTNIPRRKSVPKSTKKKGLFQGIELDDLL